MGKSEKTDEGIPLRIIHQEIATPVCGLVRNDRWGYVVRFVGAGALDGPIEKCRCAVGTLAAAFPTRVSYVVGRGYDLADTVTILGL